MTTEAENALERFRVALSARDTSAHTVASYVSDVQRFATWYHVHRPSAPMVAETTMADVRAYRDHMVDVLRRKPATVNRHLLSLRRFFTVMSGAGDRVAATLSRLDDRRLIQTVGGAHFLAGLT